MDGIKGQSISMGVDDGILLSRESHQRQASPLLGCYRTGGRRVRRLLKRLQVEELRVRSTDRLSVPHGLQPVRPVSVDRRSFRRAKGRFAIRK
jgi:hypothetical protein